MVEFIFVIVIIRILAIVAISEMSATRDDTKLSALMANTKICVDSLVGSYSGNEVLTDMDTVPALCRSKS